MKLATEFFIVTLFVFLFCDSAECQDEKSNVVENTVYDEGEFKEKGSLNGFPEKPKKLTCPEIDFAGSFFSVRCKVNKECSHLGNKDMVCCNNRCLKGVLLPLEEPVHSPTLFGLIDRVCPSEGIPEIFEIKQCTSDKNCSPRICCPETMPNGDVVGFCRTAEPKFDRVPGMKRFMEPLRVMMSYMQCTPPPPSYLDLFPKECKNALDCFPNLCCQEKGKRYCRPPRRSLLTLMTTVAQRIVPTEVARDFINRIAP